jgi:hypothetical protein
MRSADVTLLLKKILVGMVVAAIPLLIMIGGLWFTRALLARAAGRAAAPPSHSDAQGGNPQ